jgi:hypothetical protein
VGAELAASALGLPVPEEQAATASATTSGLADADNLLMALLPSPTTTLNRGGSMAAGSVVG